MAETLNCSPCYDGRPDYDPSLGTAVLPQETLARSRLFAGGTFFRSKLSQPGDNDFQGQLCNDIALSVVSAGTAFTLNVYFQNELVETYSTSQALNCPMMDAGVAIPDLRSQTASSEYISMPARGTDEQDMLGVDDQCLSAFAMTSMTGGDGPGEAQVSSIRTGPERAIVFIDEKENANGTPFSPGAGSNLIQWDFDALAFIPYVIDADCALPDDRCP